MLQKMSIAQYSIDLVSELPSFYTQGVNWASDVIYVFKSVLFYNGLE